MSVTRSVYIAGWPVMAANYSFEDDVADMLEALPMQERIGAYLAYRKETETKARKRGADAFHRLLKSQRSERT